MLTCQVAVVAVAGEEAEDGVPVVRVGGDAAALRRREDVRHREDLVHVEGDVRVGS